MARCETAFCDRSGALFDAQIEHLPKPGRLFGPRGLTIGSFRDPSTVDFDPLITDTIK
jgi:hypothetical protein